MDYREMAKATLAEIKADDVPNLAAGVAFKIFLALFPGLIAAVAIFSLVTQPEDLPRLMEAMSATMPDEAIAVLEQPLAQLTEGGGGAAGGLAVGAILAGLWAATSAATSLIKALNRAYEVPDQRTFVAQRGVALVLTIALLLTLTALVVLLVAGRQVQAALLPDALDGTGVGTLVAGLRIVGAVFVLMVLFAFTYWLGPNRERPPWRWITPGAVVGVVGWLVAAGAFTLYAQNFGNYDATYGALGGVIVLMLWLQISMMAILVGAELNHEFEVRAGAPAATDAGSGFPPPTPPPPGGKDATVR
jgi:membrane protein